MSYAEGTSLRRIYEAWKENGAETRADDLAQRFNLTRKRVTQLLRSMQLPYADKRRPGRPRGAAVKRKPHKPSKPPETTSALLRELFLEAERQDITLTEISDHFDMTRIGVHKWRNGDNMPGINKVEKLADMLGMAIRVERRDGQP